MQVKECTPIPSNWETFLKLEQNKAKLSQFFAERIGSVATEGKQLCTTVENNSVCAAHINNIHDLVPYDYQEANTRIILHSLHCPKQVYDRVNIKPVDTDFVVLAVAAFHSIPMLKELRIDFGVNKHHRYILAHGIANVLGK